MVEIMWLFICSHHHKIYPALDTPQNLDFDQHNGDNTSIMGQTSDTG
jgi:hypothetical protein